MNKTVANLIDTKGSDVYSIGPDDSVYDALVEMADKNVGALLVIADGSLVGMMSERDYARKIILHDLSSRDTKVAEIMSTAVITVAPDTSLAECMETMTDHHIRHLPVVEGARLAGLVSIGDVVRGVIDEQRFLIDQLHNYITG